MSRWRAAGYHLLLSIAIISIVAAVVVWLWYPVALLHVAGIDRLIGLIAAVDITVGPLLTLIVYKHGKKGLKFDLTLIALVQLSLLAYGMHALALKRPVFLVGIVDRFELVTANQIPEADLAEGKPPYDTLAWTGATLVGAVLPDDPRERSDLMFEEIEGRQVHTRPKFFKPFDAVGPALAKSAIATARFVEQLPPGEQSDVKAALGQQAIEETAVLPLLTANGAASMLVDARTAAPIAPLSIDYWKAMRQN